MARNWIGYMTAERRTAWGIPQAQFVELGTVFSDAQTALQKATDDTQRTPVVTVECNVAFKALEAKMRFFKKHYFLVPPLTLLDLSGLGLPLGDTIQTDIPSPKDEADTDLLFPAYHLIELCNIRPVGLREDDPRSQHGTRIHIGILGGTSPYTISAVPTRGEELPWSKFTRRKRERFNLDGNSGKEVFVSLAFENAKGDIGPYGPIHQGFVP
jgi:hypothetical protein